MSKQKNPRRPGRSTSKILRSSRDRAGTMPGGQVVVRDGIPSISGKIRCIDWNEKSFHDGELTAGQLKQADSGLFRCLILEGLGEGHDVQTLGTFLNLHPLMIEDMLNTHHPPKVEFTDDSIFLVLPRVDFDPEKLEVNVRSINIVITPHTLLVAGDSGLDMFEPVHERLKLSRGRIRRLGTDYLGYAMADCLVDHLLVTLEFIGDRIEMLEEAVVTHVNEITMNEIHHLRRELLVLRRVARPLRDLSQQLERIDNHLISDEVRPFLRDLSDHVVRVMDVTDTWREMVSGLLDLYLSSVSNRMNEVMKVLTLIATIFMPLSFIAGVYGMNFDWIPETKWDYGYFYCLALMIVSAGGFLVYFRRKGWL